MLPYISIGKTLAALSQKLGYLALLWHLLMLSDFSYLCLPETQLDWTQWNWRTFCLSSEFCPVCTDFDWWQSCLQTQAEHLIGQTHQFIFWLQYFQFSDIIMVFFSFSHGPLFFLLRCTVKWSFSLTPCTDILHYNLCWLHFFSPLNWFKEQPISPFWQHS